MALSSRGLVQVRVEVDAVPLGDVAALGGDEQAWTAGWLMFPSWAATFVPTPVTGHRYRRELRGGVDRDRGGDGGRGVGDPSPAVPVNSRAQS
jgi:hypothetical protein